MLPCMRVVGVFSLLLLGCMGPAAPDAELCRDVIARVCAQPVCPNAAVRLALPEMDCNVALQARTGCDSLSFQFSTPSRARVLECRLPLVRSGETIDAHPACDDVDETVRVCPDVVRFLGGTP